MMKRNAVQDKPIANEVTNLTSKPVDGAKPALGDDHPLNDIIGSYEGPVWERILKNIKRNRKLEDTEARAASE